MGYNHKKLRAMSPEPRANARSSKLNARSYFRLQIRSSAWLEHYTDNVGVTSSNLVGSTEISCEPWAMSREPLLEARN